MNPSVQCIFERILAGIALVAAVVGFLGGAIWFLEYSERRWPPKPRKPNPLLDKIFAWLIGTSLSGAVLWGCYYIGKDVLASLGICHLK